MDAVASLDPILLSIVLFGLITSYTDLKYGKIKNLHVAALLIVGVGVNIFYTGMLTNFSSNIYSDFMQTLINIIISFALGILMWIAGFWTQGDAKLFLGYSVLLPVFVYNHGYLTFFPSVVILINTFIPLAAFLFLSSIVRIKLDQLKKTLGSILSRDNLTFIALYIFGFMFIFNWAIGYSGLRLSYILYILIFYAIMEGLRRIPFKSLKIIFVILSLARIILFYDSVVTLDYIIEFLLVLFVFICLRFVLLVSNFSFVRSVRIKELTPGMFLEDDVVEIGGKYARVSGGSFLSRVFNSSGNSIIESHRLTEEDVKKLKKLRAENKIKFDTVDVVKTTVFAPFIFLAVLLTYLLQGSLLYFIAQIA
jgi:hypothetical protein